MGEGEYPPSKGVLIALGLIGIALASGMFIVEVFPIRASGGAGLLVVMPTGVSLDPTLSFSPGLVRIVHGGSVQWVNKDDFPHTATATAWPKGAVKFDSGALDSGDSFTVTFLVAGNYSYHCQFHPGWMRGNITVT